MLDLTIEQRVANGVALLDEKRPGWFHKFSIKRLDRGSPYRCVLGQSYGDYLDCMSALAIDSGYPLGLDCDGTEFTALTNRWRQIIPARREPVSS